MFRVQLLGEGSTSPSSTELIYHEFGSAPAKARDLQTARLFYGGGVSDPKGTNRPSLTKGKAETA
jgi:hypothetical protein